MQSSIQEVANLLQSQPNALITYPVCKCNHKIHLCPFTSTKNLWWTATHTHSLTHSHTHTWNTIIVQDFWQSLYKHILNLKIFGTDVKLHLLVKFSLQLN